MEGPSARALAARPVEADGGMKRRGQTRCRPNSDAVKKPAAQRRRGSVRFTPAVGAAVSDDRRREPAASDAVSGVGLTMSAEVAGHNSSITAPTSALPPVLLTDAASGADEFANNFAFTL